MSELKILNCGLRPQEKEDDDDHDHRSANPALMMPDGSIYAGVSPDTGKPMYTTPKDAPLT